MNIVEYTKIHDKNDIINSKKRIEKHEKMLLLESKRKIKELEKQHIEGQISKKSHKIKYYKMNNNTNNYTKPTYRKTPISSTLKRLVWNKYISEEIGKAKCYCCNLSDITQQSFHCGHVNAEKKGGKTTLSNLRPICQNCNSSMGTKNMHKFMEQFK